MKVVKIRQAQMICSSPVDTVSNNAGLNSSIGAGNGDARSRQYNDDWDE